MVIDLHGANVAQEEKYLKVSTYISETFIFKYCTKMSL